MSLNIRDDDRCVQETLNRLQARVDDLKPVMREIAGRQKESTDEAIATQTAPDGSTWKPLVESTIVDRLRRRYRAARAWSARLTSSAGRARSHVRQMESTAPHNRHVFQRPGRHTRGHSNDRPQPPTPENDPTANPREDMPQFLIHMDGDDFRMQNRRFTRLTNGFSKRVANHAYQVVLYIVFHNWCRKHTTLGMTPAQAVGPASEPRDIDWIVSLVEAKDSQPGPRRPYRREGRKKLKDAGIKRVRGDWVVQLGKGAERRPPDRAGSAHCWYPHVLPWRWGRCGGLGAAGSAVGAG